MITNAILFLVVTLRALIEVVFWALIGRTALSLLAGRHAADNVVLGMFDVCLKPPRSWIARWLPRIGALARDLLLGMLLASLWLALAACKGWLLR